MKKEVEVEVGYAEWGVSGREFVGCGSWRKLRDDPSEQGGSGTDFGFDVGAWLWLIRGMDLSYCWVKVG